MQEEIQVLESESTSVVNILAQYGAVTQVS